MQIKPRLIPRLSTESPGRFWTISILDLAHCCETWLTYLENGWKLTGCFWTLTQAVLAHFQLPRCFLWKAAISRCDFRSRSWKIWLGTLRWWELRNRTLYLLWSWWEFYTNWVNADSVRDGCSKLPKMHPIISHPSVAASIKMEQDLKQSPPS